MRFSGGVGGGGGGGGGELECNVCRVQLSERKLLVELDGFKTGLKTLGGVGRV